MNNRAHRMNFAIGSMHIRIEGLDQRIMGENGYLEAIADGMSLHPETMEAIHIRMDIKTLNRIAAALTDQYQRLISQEKT